MRISAAALANGLAWGVFALIFAAAVVMADVLGFLGLLIIGAITWLVCARAAQDDNPGWRNWQAFQRIAPDEAGPASREQRAARWAEWQVGLDPIRFFGRCGMALTLIGAAGFAWQYWAAAASNGH